MQVSVDCFWTITAKSRSGLSPGDPCSEASLPHSWPGRLPGVSLYNAPHLLALQIWGEGLISPTRWDFLSVLASQAIFFTCFQHSTEYKALCNSLPIPYPTLWQGLKPCLGAECPSRGWDFTWKPQLWSCCPCTVLGPVYLEVITDNAT